MGRLSRELTDPWGLLVAGVAGGVAWAALGPVALGVGVGAAVYGVKVAAGALLGGPDEPPLAKPARPPYGSPAGTWLKRAETAVRALDDLARGPDLTPADVATTHAVEEADAVLETMRRLGGQSVAVGKALAQADSPGLDEEATRLRALSDAAPDDAVARQSADAVADRVAVRDRLRTAQAGLEARLQSSALGLEGLVARVAELRATSAAAGQLDASAADLAALTAEVEGLRVGLSDVEQAARKALGS
ncbi:MAG: hypothetical protein ACXVGH_08060 [Mycobacteriales bacterium]